MSSVGQAIGGLVGGVIGFFVGGPTGAYYGAQIGMMAGGLIDPPKGPVINGPRLDDLSIQTSTYGAFIPRNYATIAQYGNIFWLQGDAITEVQTTTTEGGKGGPETTTNTWSYYATFAVGLCQGPISGIKRIWVGSDLYYDGSASDSATVTGSIENAGYVSIVGGATPKAFGNTTGTKGFTVYLGTDTQTADSLIQADKGVANTPAYRGLAYIVFENLPLKKYGNSLAGAQVKIEIVKNGTVSDVVTLKDTLTATTGSHAMAMKGRYIYVSVMASDLVNVYDVGNPESPVLVNSISIAGQPRGLEVSGAYLYVTTYTGKKLYIYNLASPASPELISNVTSGTGNAYSVIINNGYAYICEFGGDNLIVMDVQIPDTPSVMSTTSISSPRHAVISGNYIFITSYTANAVVCYDITNPASPFFVSSVAVNTNPSKVEIRDNYLFVAHDGNDNLLSINIANPAAMSVVGTIVIGGFPNFVHVVGSYAYCGTTGGDAVKIFDVSNPASMVLVATGSLSSEANAPYWLAVYGNYIYAVTQESQSGGRLWTFFFAPQVLSSNPVTLASIVEAESLTSNLLTAADLDTTELTDSVRGYKISQIGAIRGAIEPVRAAWPFDVVQRGYKIKFKRRGSSPVATITTGDLDARAAGDNPGVQVTDSREMDIMLPKKVVVSYADVTREYDANSQEYERKNTDAVSVHTVELPIVLNADEAAQTAEKLCYLRWIERYDVSLVAPPSFSALEPADVVTVTGNDASWELRLTSVNTLPDSRIECRGKYNKAAIYTSTASGEEGLVTGGTLSPDGYCVYQLLDIPLLRDDDDTAGFPVAMVGYQSGWPGGVLYQSSDAGQSWTDLRAFLPGAVIGYATTTLSTHGGTMYDTASTLTAYLYAGTLSSVTEAQLFAGQNWFAYGVDGRWEIIAARKAVLQADGGYILSDFLRGQYGTEWATGVHAAYDKLVVLDAAKMSFISINSNGIGVAKYYRAITVGKTLDSDTDLAFTYRAVNLECLSPVHLSGNRNPSTNDWTLTWVRRSRRGGWPSYVDVLLGEASESYEIDVYSGGTYTTLKRTLTASTQTVAYTSAQQVTDFGSNQATLYLKIYQLSATVGRGYPLTISITR